MGASATVVVVQGGRSTVGNRAIQVQKAGTRAPLIRISVVTKFTAVDGLSKISLGEERSIFEEGIRDLLMLKMTLSWNYCIEKGRRRNCLFVMTLILIMVGEESVVLWRGFWFLCTISRNNYRISNRILFLEEEPFSTCKFYRIKIHKMCILIDSREITNYKFSTFLTCKSYSNTCL